MHLNDLVQGGSRQKPWQHDPAWELLAFHDSAGFWERSHYWADWDLAFSWSGGFFFELVPKGAKFKPAEALRWWWVGPSIFKVWQWCWWKSCPYSWQKPISTLDLPPHIFQQFFTIHVRIGKSCSPSCYVYMSGKASNNDFDRVFNALREICSSSLLVSFWPKSPYPYSGDW